MTPLIPCAVLILLFLLFLGVMAIIAFVNLAYKKFLEKDFIKNAKSKEYEYIGDVSNEADSLF